MSEVRLRDATKAIEKRLGKKGAKHCERVSQAAGELAKTYGVDEERARLAGMLHDWDREQSTATLLEAARAALLEITDADAASPHLLHARTGAVGAKAALPGLDDEVLSAIARHTLGGRDMTPLQMVVYLADMIETHREYPGVEELRDAVGRVPLRELFAMGYWQSMMHLVTARKPIHPTTVVVWNEYVAVSRR